MCTHLSSSQVRRLCFRSMDAAESHSRIGPTFGILELLKCDISLTENGICALKGHEISTTYDSVGILHRE